ncbi:hypothetical protein N7449_001350 [Penicillium cf. viridicatum]|uniref:phosphopyruvate hydratase n=1 Tax=Penicillium cf. viridicatum TaxID=2972119 RepID=A0A9W9N6M3_9EURO|nr:hypothetical protein N7449_001350 [Penicillium cf. viridicatum]
MIRSIQAAQRLDSRGHPTVQVDPTTDKGTFRATVPFGTSTDANEASEVRDKDSSAYGGKGAQKAVSNIELVIGPALVQSGLKVDTHQKMIDCFLNNLDGTHNKSKLGVNAFLDVSMACARVQPPLSQKQYKWVPHEALDFLVEAVSLAGYTGRIKFAIDPASSEFFRDGNYDIGFKDDKPNLQSPKQLAELHRSLLQNHPIVLPGDPFAETGWDSWIEFNQNCPIELGGDDLLVTNTKDVQEANDKRACNSMLLKINQIGTISEGIEAADLAYSFDWSILVSHRSGLW